MESGAASIEQDMLWAAVVVLLCILAVGAVFWRRMQRRAEALAASLADASQLLGAAAFDPRTGLVPREHFDSALEAAVQRSDRTHEPICVLFVDIDHFNDINQSLGHEVGDNVLLQYGQRVHAVTPDKTAAMRFGGDQIVVVIEAGVAMARDIASDMVSALAQPFEVPDGEAVALSASVGVAVYPVHGPRGSLIANASMAAQGVKAAGGNAYAVFDPTAVVDLHEQSQLIADLRAAVANKQFELFYQPKINAVSLQITAAEALIRWRHPVRGLVPPSVFIPLAERHGLIGAIGNWVIDDACRQAGVWRKAGLRMRVAINLSAFQMRQDDFVDRLLKALKKNDLQPRRFTVEITESLALENTKATQDTFERLRKAGLHVAIDDFGAGQTSIAYLRGLPASELKLDMSLVTDLETSPEARTIAEALIKLSHALKRKVVAEGVESLAQRDILMSMGCDEMQGFLFARPMSARGLALWAIQDKPAASNLFRPSLFKETMGGVDGRTRLAPEEAD